MFWLPLLYTFGFWLASIQSSFQIIILLIFCPNPHERMLSVMEDLQSSPTWWQYIVMWSLGSPCLALWQMLTNNLYLYSRVDIYSMDALRASWRWYSVIVTDSNTHSQRQSSKRVGSLDIAKLQNREGVHWILRSFKTGKGGSGGEMVQCQYELVNINRV